MNNPCSFSSATGADHPCRSVSLTSFSRGGELGPQGSEIGFSVACSDDSVDPAAGRSPAESGPTGDAAMRFCETL